MGSLLILFFSALKPVFKGIFQELLDLSLELLNDKECLLSIRTNLIATIFYINTIV